MKSHVASFKTQSPASVKRPSLSAAASTCWRQIVRWHALYRQRQQLASLSDGMLKDIGLSRADIEPEVSRPFWDDPLRKG